MPIVNPKVTMSEPWLISDDGTCITGDAITEHHRKHKSSSGHCVKCGGPVRYWVNEPCEHCGYTHEVLPNFRSHVRTGKNMDQQKPKFKRGDEVCKIRGSQWNGIVVGEYSTTLTPEGYAVESNTEKGSVQIYPAAALALVKAAEQSSVFDCETDEDEYNDDVDKEHMYAVGMPAVSGIGYTAGPFKKLSEAVSLNGSDGAYIYKLTKDFEPVVLYTWKNDMWLGCEEKTK